MIRKAELRDADAIFRALQRAKVHTVYATTSVARDLAMKTIRQCISGPQCYARVAEHDGEVTGALLGIKERIWFSHQSEAKDIVFHSLRAMDTRDLVEDFCRWAWSDNRVDAVLLAQSSGCQVERTGKVFEALGFTKVGAVHRLGRWDVEGQRVAI